MMGKVVAGFVGSVGAIIALIVVFGSWYTVDQGERAVVLRNGAIVGTSEPGWSGKMPWIDEVVYFSIQSRYRPYVDMAAYSRDQQPAVLQVSVNYRMPADRVAEVYENYGSEEALVSRLLDRRVLEEAKTVFGRFNAVTAIQERARLNNEVAEAITAAVSGPILIEGVQIENIDFSDAYEASIEQRMLAEVEVQRLVQNAEREKVQAEIVVIQANAEADAVRARAQALGDQARLIGEGEADAIRARGAALRDNPLLIELTSVEKWNGALPTTMPPDVTVPFLNLPQ